MASILSDVEASGKPGAVQYDYLAERREALAKFEAHLMGIVG